MKNSYIIATMLLGIVVLRTATADETVRADSHAPIGVMGDHLHRKGEWMLSYRFMQMSMGGNLSGSNTISADTIVSTQVNRFFGNPNQPPTLRVVPTEMNMDMHMFGAMFAPSDSVTLMLMVNYLDKNMDHISYQGGAGTTQLGTFTSQSSGLGDASAVALVRLGDQTVSKLHLIAGVSIPTGSTDEVGQILTPANTRPTVRLPYPMQLSSGTVDPIIGLNYAGNDNKVSWGTQWRSTFRVDDNEDGYRLGDEHRLTAWLSYLWSDPVSTSLRLEYVDRSKIEGIDGAIALPVQTADPDRQGSTRTDLSLGINIAGFAGLQDWRLALEYAFPISQNLEGPQLETDSIWAVGLQRSF